MIFGNIHLLAFLINQVVSAYEIHMYSRISISRNSDISNSAKLEASIWIKKNILIAFSDHNLALETVKNSPNNFEISRFDCTLVAFLTFEKTEYDKKIYKIIIEWYESVNYECHILYVRVQNCCTWCWFVLHEVDVCLIGWKYYFR